MTDTDRPALWVEYEGVLTAPVAELVRQFADRVQVPAHALRESLAQLGESGIPPAAGPHWAAQLELVLEREFGVVSRLDRFRELWIDLCRPDRRWLDQLAELRADGVFVGLLTAVPPGHRPNWLRLAPAELFDARLFWPAGLSGRDAGAVLRQAEQQSGRSAAGSLLLDRDEQRCETARLIGWQAATRCPDSGPEQLRALTGAHLAPLA